jgi:hypothetical protein
MKIFMTNKGYTESINFVDENNVLVGYDFEQCCCEIFGFAITDDIPKGMTKEMYEHSEDLEKYIGKLNIALKDYRLDTDFIFQNNEEEQEHELLNTVVFKLENYNNDGEVKYLTLYNSHNGYYSHGFSMSDSIETLHKGSL